MLYNTDLIIIFLIISYLDKFAIYLSKWRYNNSDYEVHHNTRWFFIHFFVNLFITIVSFNDLKYCLHNSHNCYDTLNNFFDPTTIQLSCDTLGKFLKPFQTAHSSNSCNPLVDMTYNLNIVTNTKLYPHPMYALVF